MHFSQENDRRIEIKLYICGREDDNINLENVFETKTDKTPLMGLLLLAE